MRAHRIGQAGLTGWRRPLAERVADGLAARTGLRAGTVLGVLGAVSMAFTARRLVRISRTLARELRD